MEHLSIGRVDVPIRQLFVAVAAGLALGMLLLYLSVPMGAGPVDSSSRANGTKPEDTDPDTKPATKPTKKEDPLDFNESYADLRKKFQTKLTKTGPYSADDKKADLVPPKPFSDSLKDFNYKSGGLQLGAWGSKLKPGEKAKPGILLLTDEFRFNPEAYKPEKGTNAETALTANHAVVLPMLRGQSGMPGNFSLFYDEVEDVLEAGALMKNSVPAIGKVNPRYLVGYKEGGTLALLTALRDEGRTFDGVVVVGGPTDLKKAYEEDRDRYKDAVRFDESSDNEWKMRSPITFAKQLQVPTLFLYAGNSPLKEQYEAFKDASGEAKKNITIMKVPKDTLIATSSEIAKYLTQLRNS